VQEPEHELSATAVWPEVTFVTFAVTEETPFVSLASA
jgi:hypothetical protein